MQQDELITDGKVVLQAAQSVWAMNKYFILACNQEDYREIRTLLREEDRDLNAAYTVLKNAEDIYGYVATGDLPQISNALYHMAGYFKKYTSREDRQVMNKMIQSDPHQALRVLEKNTLAYQVDYLLKSRIWSKERMRPFNLVTIPINTNGVNYPANQLLWQGNYLQLK